MFRKNSYTYVCIYTYTYIQRGHKATRMLGRSFSYALLHSLHYFYFLLYVFLDVFFHVDGRETLKQFQRKLADNQ